MRSSRNQDLFYSHIYHNSINNYNFNYIIYEVIKYENIDIYKFKYKYISDFTTDKITVNKSYIGKYKSADIFNFKLYNDNQLKGILEKGKGMF